MNRLVLVGGGHAHVHVLAALAARPFAATQVTLVSPYSRQIYSGMLPGWISGHYAIEDCALALDSLARRAGVRLVQTSCGGLDLESRRLRCASGETIPFDYASIDVGPAAGHLDGAAEHALPVRPIEGLVAAWPALLDRVRTHAGEFRLAVVGDGAAAVELAFAMQARFAAEGLRHARLTLVGGNRLALPGFPWLLRHRAANLLAAKGIAHLGQRRVTGLRADHLLLEGGTPLAADAALLATGAAAPGWPAASGLSTTDDAGFIRVDPLPQSVSHPFVFAAGDVAAYADPRPKSGVFAVRAGPPLAENLRAVCQGQALKPWQPQRRALYLLSTGRKHALAAWGSFSTSGDWVWRWKDRIDRRFIAQFGS